MKIKIILAFFVFTFITPIAMAGTLDSISLLDRTRSLPVGTYSKDISRPSLELLVGLNKSAIIEKLGPANWGTEKELAYFYYNAPRGIRGGGGYALQIKLEQSIVQQAKWPAQR